MTADNRNRTGQDTDPTPIAEPPEAGAARAKRGSDEAVGLAGRRTLVKILNGIGKHADKIALALVLLALAGLTYFTARVSGTAGDAEDTASDAKAVAETATAQGATSQGAAVRAATATSAVLTTSKEKADSTGADLQALTDRVNSLEAELARARSRKRRKPIKLSPKTEKPAPASIAAAVEQAAAAPAPATEVPR